MMLVMRMEKGADNKLAENQQNQQKSQQIQRIWKNVIIRKASVDF